MNTPFFSAWQSKLAAYGRRSGHHRSASDVQRAFQRFLPSRLLAPQPGTRRRLFPLAETFWSFLWQVLQPGTSCRGVTRRVQAEYKGRRRQMASSSSAYCQARQRLPLRVIKEALSHSAAAADRAASGLMSGWTRPIKVVDATSFQMPDTKANRLRYRYPTGQKKGCGFPVARAIAIFSMAGCAIQAVSTAACYTAELVMFRPLWRLFHPGDILLGDRMFGCYSLLAAFPMRGVDVVARLHQGRRLSLAYRQRLARNDWLATFNRPRNPPPYLSSKEWQAIPDLIHVRILRVIVKRKGFRTRNMWIVTTLLDPKEYPAHAITSLYERRWQMELSFRDLKTTMGMEILRCKTPAMIEKEIRMGIIAYNLLRALMAEAARRADLPPSRISFKGTMDTIRSFHPAMLRASSRRECERLYYAILRILAEDALPLRPGRSEPRAVKRRRKPYSLLTRSRHSFKELRHRGKPARKRPHVTLS